MRVFLACILALISSIVQADEATKNTGGISDWQLAFGLGVEQYREDYVDSASIRGDQRIVTTERTYETLPSAWLTMNWNVWRLGARKSSIVGNDVYNTKFGFFTGVKLIDSNAQAFSSFSLGPQISFQTETRVISVGLGWVTHPTKRYAQGIESGVALPEQYDDIVYQEGTENSYMLMMSIGI